MLLNHVAEGHFSAIAASFNYPNRLEHRVERSHYAEDVVSTGRSQKYNLTHSREGLFHDELRGYLKMDALSDANFKLNYQSHLKHLKLIGLQPKTIEAYSRAIRRIDEFFDHQIDSLSEQQLVDYFTDLVASHFWSSVKLDLYGLKFYAYVCVNPGCLLV